MPRPTLRILARVFFAGVGLAFAAFAVNLIATAVSSASRGCHLVFARSDMWEPPSNGPIPSTMPDCQQYVDVVPIVVAVLGAALLLATAARFGHTDRASHLIIGAGALLGVVASAIPMVMIWWVSDYYDGSAPDAIGIALGSVPLLLGVGAAWVTWRTHRPQPSRRPAASTEA